MGQRPTTGSNPELTQKIVALRERFDMVRSYDPVWHDELCDEFDKGLLALIHTERLALLEQMEGIIGEDQDHAPVTSLGIWSHDIAKYEYNKLRAQQRMELQKLKEKQSE